LQKQVFRYLVYPCYWLDWMAQTLLISFSRLARTSLERHRKAHERRVFQLIG
jgi:hypothetical protein